MFKWKAMWSLSLIVTLLPCGLCQDYVALLSMNGIEGEVTFTSNGQDTFATVGIRGQGASAYNTLLIKEWPAVFGQQFSHNDVCNDLGNTVLTISGISSDDTVQINIGEDELFHKSVLITGGAQPICATILSAYDVTHTLHAKFVGPVVGGVWFRKRSSRLGMYILSDLAYGVEYPKTSNNTLFRLVQFVDGFVDEANFSKRCQALHYYNVIIPDLKVGSHVSLENRQVSFIQRMHGVHMNIGVVSGDKVIACASVATVEPKVVRALISWENVKGSVTITQSSPFDVTETDVKMVGLKHFPVSYHIHEFPVPQRHSTSDQRCSPGNVGGHFNPYNAANFPVNGTPDQYEIGDLSGKYEKMSTDTYTVSFLDTNLPLFGVNSVVGRSIVLHRSDGSRWVCGNIDYPTARVKTAVAQFRSPAYGTMYFRQSLENSQGDTSIFVQLSNLDGTPTKAHNFHVHVYSVGEDCASTGPHYNPTEVSTSGNYSTLCSPFDPLRCELGDLSGRHQAVDISGTLAASSGKFFFTDTHLPLSGPNSIIGRSIVVHAANGSASRYACANITLLRKTVVKASGHWYGDESDGFLSGDVVAYRESEFDLTKIEFSVNSNRRDAVDMKINTLPIFPTAQGLNQCLSTQNVFNPFNALPVSTMGQTSDMYAVGDLSGKFGKVYLQGYTLRTLDGNFPMSSDIGAAGRPVVVYDKSAKPWKCANLEMTSADKTGHVIEAQSLFSSVLNGYVRMKQIVYEDGSSTSTSIEIYVNHHNSSAKSSNNWHIHVDPVTSEEKCGEALGHYNPYMVNISAPIYGTRKDEPSTYEIGDLSGKHEAYIIGGGRSYYLDDDVPLHTDKTVLGRSLVFHVEGSSARLACANIWPLTNLFTFSFSSAVQFDRYRFTATVARAMGIERMRVVVIHSVAVPFVKNGCSSVMVHFAGDVASSSAREVLQGRGMWPYVPTNHCGSHVGRM